MAASPAASARRSWETWTCRVLTEPSGGRSPHTPSMSRSTETGRPAFMSSIAKMSPCRLRTARVRSPCSTSSGPSTPKRSWSSAT